MSLTPCPEDLLRQQQETEATEKLDPSWKEQVDLPGEVHDKESNMAKLWDEYVHARRWKDHIELVLGGDAMELMSVEEAESLANNLLSIAQDIRRSADERA